MSIGTMSAERAVPVHLAVAEYGMSRLQPATRTANTVVMTMSPIPPPLAGRVLFAQQWLDVTFLHWPVRPAEVERFMPPGTRPDVIDGLSYVALVPLRIRRTGLGQHVAIPYVGSFPEVNVRLYSVDDAGRHGIVFRTLDATRLAVVALARWAMRVPYVFSSIRASPYPPTPSRRPVPMPDTSRRGYHVRRRYLPGPNAGSRVTVDLGDPVPSGELEVFLTARWGMHSTFAGRGLWLPVQHESWPLYRARLVELDDSLIAAAGVTPAGPMLPPLWSPGVHVSFGAPVRVHPTHAASS
jgi:uncharacterized protein